MLKDDLTACWAYRSVCVHILGRMHPQTDGLSHPIKKDDRQVVFFYGVGDGTRTHNAWNHNPVLCQLNYTHHI